MSQYPFLPKIKEILKDKGKDAEWLGPLVGRTGRWVYTIGAIEDMSIGYVMKISEVLEFDFMADYTRYIGTGSVLHLLKEPDAEYGNAKQDDITIQLTIRGDIKKAQKVLETIKRESAKDGFKID